MTWKELQTITLQKMFITAEDDPLSSGLSDPFLPAMPAAANEGLLLLSTAGRFILRCLQIPAEAAPEGDMECYDLKALCEDFYAFDMSQIYLRCARGYRRAEGLSTEGESILWLPHVKDAVWTVYYLAYPAPITGDTLPDTLLPLHPEAAVLLPLYMASQLYKDDDAGLASLYRQEFEIGLDTLRRRALKLHPSDGQITGLTRWW